MAAPASLRPRIFGQIAHLNSRFYIWGPTASQPVTYRLYKYRSDATIIRYDRRPIWLPADGMTSLAGAPLVGARMLAMPTRRAGTRPAPTRRVGCGSTARCSVGSNLSCLGSEGKRKGNQRMARDKPQMAKPKGLGIPHALLGFFRPRPSDTRNSHIVHCRARLSPKKKFCDRSHDVYENKGQIWRDIDCSHDLYENTMVTRKLGVMPRYH
jgi:hypothetical protein